MQLAEEGIAPASTFDVIALAETAPGFAPGAHLHSSNRAFTA